MSSDLQENEKADVFHSTEDKTKIIPFGRFASENCKKKGSHLLDPGAIVQAHNNIVFLIKKAPGPQYYKASMHRGSGTFFPDSDHIGQLDKVLNTFDVGEVWLSGNTNNSQTFQRLLAAIESHGVDYYEPRMGDEFEIGPLKIVVLYPETISEKDNEESISLKLTYGQIRFIITGDASKSDELNMLNSGLDLQADILQLGHHGSSTSTHSSFLNEVNPVIAIYSAGLNNSYGHPHDEVVNLVQSSGIQLYGTDVHGTIIVSTDGKDYKVLTNKDGTISPTSSIDTTNSDSTNQQSEPPQSNKNCIDVNSATLEQVTEIVHIGPARAEELIQQESKKLSCKDLLA